MRRFLLLTLVFGCHTMPAPSSAGEPVVEATSLLGEPLGRPQLPDEPGRAPSTRLPWRQYEIDSTDVDAIIWLGRCTAYLGRW